MWQVALLFYFLFGTASYLLRRVLAQSHSTSYRALNATFFLLFLLPATVVLVPFFPHNLDVGMTNLLLLLGGSVIWPLLNLVSFRANKETEAGVFVVISNLSPLFTLAIALPFLHEELLPIQFLGIGLLIFSGILAAASQKKGSLSATPRGIMWSLLSAAILGVAVAYEGFMLSRVDFGTYLVYGWGAQILWAALLAGPELKKIPGFFMESVESARTVFAWGFSSVLRSIAFVLALKLSLSASIISAASNFMSVAVVVAAYVFLRERGHIIEKMLAVATGVVGLLLIAT